MAAVASEPLRLFRFNASQARPTGYSHHAQCMVFGAAEPTKYGLESSLRGAWTNRAVSNNTLRATCHPLRSFPQFSASFLALALQGHIPEDGLIEAQLRSHSVGSISCRHEALMAWPKGLLVTIVHKHLDCTSKEGSCIDVACGSPPCAATLQLEYLRHYFHVFQGVTSR
jgi:hypothetical protein